jgi:hypothetical protein
MARSATELAAPPLLDVDGLAVRLGVTALRSPRPVTGLVDVLLSASSLR